MRHPSLFFSIILATVGTASADPLTDAGTWLSRAMPFGHPAAAPTPTIRGRSCRRPPIPPSADGANKACLAAAGALAAQHGDTLTLRMDDGTRKSFKDKDASGDSGYGYALVDFDPATHLFVVGDVGRDVTTYTLVDGRTGVATETGERQPFVSPNGQWRFDVDPVKATYVLAAAAAPDTPVWDTDTTKTDTSGLEIVGWLDDNRLRLARKEKPFDLVRADDGKWTIDEAPPPAPPSLPSAPTRKGLAKDVARCGIRGDWDQADSVLASDACQARLGEMAQKKGDTLTIALAEGKTATFVDTRYEADKPPLPSYLSYSVVAFSRAAHVFVLLREKTIVSNGTRENAFQTIDSRTGASRDFATFPYVSPDGAMALEIAPNGTMRLRDLAIETGGAIWNYPANAHDEVSPHTVFLGWDDARTARLLVDDTQILILSRTDDGAWSGKVAPLTKAFEAKVDAACPLPKDADQSTEAQCLAKIPDIASRDGRDGEVLTLKLEDGATTREVNRRTDSDTVVVTRLVTYNPKQHQFAMASSYYEGSARFLIDAVSGERTKLDGAPIFSPDRSSFLVIDDDYATEPGINLWKNAPRPVLSWTYKRPKGAPPSGNVAVLGWAGEDSVKLKIDKKTVTFTRDPSGAWQVAPPDKRPEPARKPKPAKKPDTGKSDPVAAK